MPHPLLQPPLITLTTDFGLTDTYVGVMKGVIYAIAPDARLVDLTHDVTPQNILEASARLEAAVDYFSPGTIHVIVVDPGVGSERAACVVQTEIALFVAPDNGVLTLPLRHQAPERAVRLTERAQPYFRQPLSATFHGRDVFAPIAAHLAAGVPLDALGDEVPPDNLVRLPLPVPYTTHNAKGRPRLLLHVLYVDRFGNLITDLERSEWERWQTGLQTQGADTKTASITVQAGSRRWQSLARTFADVSPGEPLAYWGSGGRLEIAVRDGNAARLLPLAPGDTLTITL
jgi:S-adenosylmethionine hydrolase